MEHVFIDGDRLTLRTLTKDDASEDYESWLNDPVVNKYLEKRSITIPELKNYIKDKNENPSALLLGICWKENGKHIGNIKLEPINREKNDAVLGILIGDKQYWGRGVATEAIGLLSDYAFTTLDLDRLELGVISEHTAAIRAYEKCGFKIIRTEPKALNHDGAFYDRVVMEKRK